MVSEETAARRTPRATERNTIMTQRFIDDIDVFDGMRWLLDDGIDLDNRAAVERALNYPYANDEQTSKRFVDWCIKAARANKAAVGLHREFGSGGFVPPEETQR
jgi:hypothetical protein